MIDLKVVFEDVKYIPTYANNTDACMDLKARVKNVAEIRIKENIPVWSEEDNVLIDGGETVILGTGIKVAIPEDYVMLIFPRSSTGIKLHCMLSNTTGVIDSGYRDEIKLAITNFDKSPVRIEDGQRIAQFMVIPRPKINLIPTIDNDDFRNGDRGGGIGSSGKF